MDLIRSVTPHVTGTSAHLGGSGDPSPATALGLMHALAAVAERLWGDPSLADRHLVVSGVGKVGSDVARRAAAAGARLTVADARADTAERVARETGATVIAPELAHTVPCDVFSPCALGAVLDERSIPELRCAAVCGCANNQLATPDDGDRLAARGIVYAPDFVVNAGGVINIADETGPGGYDAKRAEKRIATIHDTVLKVFERADAERITPATAADRIAEDRLAGA
jgi:leucine dehydrogenase